MDKYLCLEKKIFQKMGVYRGGKITNSALKATKLGPYSDTMPLV